MQSKPTVRSGVIVRPTYQVTHGLNLRRTDSGNSSRANERSAIEERRSGFFSESDSAHEDSFIAWRNQMQMRGCMSLHIGLIQSPTGSDRTLARAELLLQQRYVFDHPAIKRGMVNLDTTLVHH